jgi:hypothetical protein
MQFVVHEDPVGRGTANFIGRADLAPFGLDRQVEQLWFRPADEGRYEVTCIPFSAYGLALGDVVVLKDYYVSEVAEPSGHRTLRLQFGPDLPPLTRQSVADGIKNEIDRRRGTAQRVGRRAPGRRRCPARCATCRPARGAGGCGCGRSRVLGVG